MQVGSHLERTQQRTGWILSLTTLVIFSLPAFSDKLAGWGRWAYLAGVVAIAYAVYNWSTSRVRSRKSVLSKGFPPEWEKILQEKVGFYQTLDEVEKLRFRNAILIFLSEVRITGVKTTLDDTVRILVAASAIIPSFGLREWEFFNLGEVIVLPGAVATHLDPQDNRSFTLGQVNVIRAKNIMLLSKPSLLAGFQNLNDNRNVGIHEFAHVIDQADGEIDGVPRLELPQSLWKPWADLMAREIKAIHKGDSDINPYAGTNEAEFFAVTTEYFFEQPEWLEKNHPEVYNMLRKAYRQHTSYRFTDDLYRLVRPTRQRLGRNSPCPCDSGKKYKKCCLK